jgi:hypothetical protein
MNSISSIKTVPVNGPNGPTNAIMMGLDILNTEELKDFLPEVASSFLSQMMASPMDTNMMLITIIGGCTADEFKKHWTGITENDPVMQIYIGKMLIADTIHGTMEGEVLDQTSLIH